MENSQSYLDPQTLASLEGLDLQARLLVEGYVAGMHPSPYHGFSVEFAEHREYVPGDDIRHVDWKVWSKTDKLYLKQYEEETNLLLYLLLDTSESMAYASGQNVTKLKYAQFVVAALAYMVIQQQDSVGLGLFDDAVRRYLKPASQPTHLKELIHVLDVTPAREKSNMGAVFHDLAERFKKRGVVAIFSDFFDDPARILAGLKHFRHRRHEVIVFHVLDPAEVEFPFRDTTLFRGLEGLPDVLTEPHALRRAYQAEIGAFLDELKKGCRMVDIDYVPLRTDQSLEIPALKLPGLAVGPDRLTSGEAVLDESLMNVFSTLPLIWALEFANPGLLAGVAAASIPILIHLLNRRKFRETRWAAMRFLLEAIRKNQRRVRIEQWLLLALRTLLILLVVAAMAKPFLEAFGNVIAGRQDPSRAGARRLAVHGVHDRRAPAGSTRPRSWRRGS